MSNPALREGLSFDDVLLIPARSDLLPTQVNVQTRLSRNIMLNVPIASAAMDMVTEGRLAIAVAREGGIGVIHKNMTPEQQALEVDRVKRSESGMIVDPVTLGPDRSVREALAMMSRYHISGLPITTEDRRLVGILTNRDLRFETELDKPVSAAMTSKNLVTAPEGTTLEEAKLLLHEHRIEKLPVVDGDMKLRGLITTKDIEKVATFPHACKDSLGRLRVAAAVGVGPDSMERALALVERGVDALVVDTAHGHSAGVLRQIGVLKERFPDIDVIAGNVGTAEGAAALCEAGADAVKVGMGPGSICTTRVVAGAGAPQITAIMDCAEVCAPFDVPVIADGGIKYSGDITKAIAAGAHCVMIGNLLAGTEESPGDTVLYRGRTYKEYRGMGSLAVMEGSCSTRDRYGQQEVDTDKLVPEGLEGRVPYKGPLRTVVHQMLGGLRSGMGYCGVTNIEELRNRPNPKFYRISPAGLRESHPHDVIITEEAPNYQISE
ncbi:MAG TPA: IMP dehydrogenase [Armatimonadota bacterium]|jgi:IMP dehydrogenase